jgi:hypothetical protein
MPGRVLTLLTVIALGIALASGAVLAQGSPLETSLASLESQVAIALDHANLAKNSTTLEAKVEHAEHVINAIEGKSGPNYGDFNGDGTVQDFGDGTGVLGHAAIILELADAAGTAVPDDAIVAAHVTSIKASTNSVITWSTDARNAAAKVAGSSLSLADIYIGPGGKTVISNLDASLNGFGSEGGVEQAIAQTQTLGAYLAELGAEIPAPASPDTGDMSIPMFGKMLAGLGLVLVVSGGLLWRRRFQA